MAQCYRKQNIASQPLNSRTSKIIYITSQMSTAALTYMLPGTYTLIASLKPLQETTKVVDVIMKSFL